MFSPNPIREPLIQGFIDFFPILNGAHEFSEVILSQSFNNEKFLRVLQAFASNQLETSRPYVHSPIPHANAAYGTDSRHFLAAKFVAG